MGVTEAVMGGIALINGISQSRAASKAVKSAKRGMAAAPEKALAALQQFQEQFGRLPDQAEFQSLTGGDYAALQQAIYQGQAAPLQEAYEQGMQKTQEDAARRGLYSSAMVEQQEGLGRNLALALQQAASSATSQRYGLQAQELQNQNLFNQQNYLNAMNMYGTNLGAYQNLAGLFSGNAATAGQQALAANQLQGEYASGVGSMASGLLSSAQNASFQNNLLDILGRTAGSSSSSSFDPGAIAGTAKAFGSLF